MKLETSNFRIEVLENLNLGRIPGGSTNTSDVECHPDTKIKNEIVIVFPFLLKY